MSFHSFYDFLLGEFEILMFILSANRHLLVFFLDSAAFSQFFLGFLMILARRDCDSCAIVDLN